MTPANRTDGRVTRETRLSVALVAVFIPTYATLLYLQAGLMVVGIVAGSMVAGFVVWLRTTLRRPPSARAILPAYLLALALFLFHVLEEYAFDFAGRIAAAAHVQWTEAQFIEVIVLLGPAIWIAGAIGVYHRHPLGNFVAWFFFVGMMVGEPTHMLVFPLMEGGRYHYFPGMWSALAPMVPAAYGIWRMLADDQAAKKQTTSGSVRPVQGGVAGVGAA
jgi:general stress protein CsbA